MSLSAPRPFVAPPFWARFRQQICDAVLPPRCASCAGLVAGDDELCGACWREIKFITAPFCRVLGTPLPVDLGAGNISPFARKAPPSYDMARSVFHYDGIGAQLVRRLKFYDAPQLAPLLARLMVQAGSDFLAKADMLLPVPLHWRRLLARRFNQSAELARAVQAQTGIPLGIEWLQRLRYTPHQLGLTRAQRQRNLHRAFAVAPEHRAQLKGKRVVLIDDVLTTGATVEYCARALRLAGAERVYVLTAGRVVLPQLFSA